MSTKRLTEEQKEFYNELTQKFDDTVESIEMVCFDASSNVFDALGLLLPPGRKTLWVLLVYGEKGMHIYVNPSDTTILGFRVGGQKKQPKEQMLSFKSFSSWKVEQIMKKSLFGLSSEKYSLSLTILHNSPSQGEVKCSILLQTQMLAKDTLQKMQRYQNA